MSAADDESKTSEGTRIDLGDDLIEKTEIVSAPLSRKPTEKLEDVQDRIEDQLQSATILMNEGIIEEAKKILRQIILADPHQITARQKLQEIHEVELKQIFGEGQVQRIRRNPLREARIDPEAVLCSLDQDLGLDIFSTGLSLFKDRKALEDYAEKLDREMVGLSPRDRMDLGIAFLEMGLYDVAVRQFRAAARNAQNTGQDSSGNVLSATALLAYALILDGKPFEATLGLEPILGDADILPEAKIEFIYLMARAYEGLQKPQLALQWYQQVCEIDGYYRDTADRMRSLSEGSNRT